jgi:mono/diheme cytochrome c family protein
MLAAFPPDVIEATPVDPAIMAKIGPKKANPGQNKRQLIERGRELFMNETFNGNGRTCATCHPPTNNFTIDPAFIATLRPKDPLFVAELNPALANLENPDLMRNFRLILENLDGLPPQDPVFRGVPHTLALPTSINVDPNGADNQTREDDVHSTVVQATGWSADGAPGDGSLRSFAIGAVVQHFPKTLNRIAGQDFRLRTPAELDAMEAFQLSFGRQTDLNLAAMHFGTSGPNDNVNKGKGLFTDGVDGVGGSAPTCSGCHRNAGATDFTGFNGKVQTNVAMLVTPAREFARATGGDLPGDGGFDAAPELAESVDGLDVTFHGNRTMNVPPLVEAADTGPFFHNNAVDTIEEAIAFYTTDMFSTSPFVLTNEQINQIGAFLRTINALENIRSSNAYSEQAQREVQKLARQTVKAVVAETEDALQVLTGGGERPATAVSRRRGASGRGARPGARGRQDSGRASAQPPASASGRAQELGA